MNIRTEVVGLDATEVTATMTERVQTDQSDRSATEVNGIKVLRGRLRSSSVQNDMKI